VFGIYVDVECATAAKPGFVQSQHADVSGNGIFASPRFEVHHYNPPFSSCSSTSYGARCVLREGSRAREEDHIEAAADGLACRRCNEAAKGGITMRAYRLTALSFGIVAVAALPQLANAAANCHPVKVDPRCWGDTCVTRQVCTPSPYTLSEARQKGAFTFSRRHFTR